MRYINAKLTDLAPKIQGKLSALDPAESVYIWGDVGVGKTHAIAALSISYMKQGYDVQRITYEMLCLQLRGTYKPNSIQTEIDIILPLVNADKLVLEDVGVTVSTGKIESDFSFRTFMVILNERYEKCLATFITGNKSVMELEKSFDARVASRLRSGLVLEVSGEDRRIKRK